MPIEIPMPRLSDTMEEGTLVKWKVKVGDKVKSGDVLADVETDKATMELQSYDDGTVASLNVAEGEAAAVGRLLLVLAKPGENAEEAAKFAGGEKGEKKEAGSTPAKPAPPSPAPAPAAAANGLASSPSATETATRTRISPLARKIAEERGVDPATLKGSGPDGRVVKRDIPAPGSSTPASSAGSVTKPSPTPPTSAASASGGGGKIEAKLIPVSNMRKTIARRLLESKTTIPHFTVTTTVNADPLLELRGQVNHHLESRGVKLSVNDFIVRAAALAILQHPAVNCSWTEAGIQQFGDINVGVAVALTAQQGGGLVVPVIRNTDTLSLAEISSQTKASRRQGSHQGPLRPRDDRRHVHDLQPGHVRRRTFRGDYQPAAGCDPRHRRCDGKTRRPQRGRGRRT